ncbi:MAG: nucleotidyltransferase domain-containing protein [FCB group bacterium]|nr:nucleotidyltransferase domain-containing protein [FCB group bacterium]
MDKHMIESMTACIVDEVHPEEVILFGSRAKGTSGPHSDVDLLVVLADNEDTRLHRRGMTGRIYRRLAGFPVSKDILVYTRSEVDQWRNEPQHVVSAGLSEGLRLYVQP